MFRPNQLTDLLSYSSFSGNHTWDWHLGAVLGDKLAQYVASHFNVVPRDAQRSDGILLGVAGVHQAGDVLQVNILVGHRAAVFLIDRHVGIEQRLMSLWLQLDRMGQIGRCLLLAIGESRCCRQCRSAGRGGAELCVV